MSEREWIAKIGDRELRERVRSTMVELMLLGEAKAYSTEGYTSHSKASHRPPPGAREGDFDTAGPPPRERSAFEWYSWKFSRATDSIEIERLLNFAQVDLTLARGGEDARDIIKARRERDETSDKRILLERGQGVHAAIISARNGWPISWVRHVRERNGQDGELGTPREAFRELDEEHRHKVIDRLRRDGNSQREVAMRLGVSNGTVARYWPRQRARAA